MPSLIDIRRRIRSVKNTQQITKAMKMVSAAKLRRAQDRVIAARPYAALLREVLANVAAAAQSRRDARRESAAAQREEKRIDSGSVTGDKGLAGAFNSNLIKAAQRFYRRASPAPRSSLTLVGRKGRDFFRKRERHDSRRARRRARPRPTYADAAAIAQKPSSAIANGEIDAVYLIYNEFKSVMAQKLSVTQLLPVELPETASRSPMDYIFEQPPLEMLDALLPRYVEVAILPRAAGIRRGRTRRAHDGHGRGHRPTPSDMIETLTLYMNRVRQASITKEIIEVVSGAAAAE